MSSSSGPIEIVVTHPNDVIVALTSPDLAPPPCPANLQSGATAELRDAMARFSHGQEHTRRRLDINEAIGSLDGFPFEQESFTRTRSFLAQASTAAARSALDEETTAQAELDEVILGRITEVIPTETLASALGVGASDLDEVRRDTGMLAASIGRGGPASVESDRAASRLLERFAAHPGGAVANVSLLYQNHDATAALFAATMEGHRSDCPRRSALERTVRVVLTKTFLDITQDSEVGSSGGDSNQLAPVASALTAGTVLSLSLQDLDVEFGAGAHQCPGETMATGIVAGITRALGYR